MPVTGWGDWPACSARVSNPGYLGPAKTLVQVFSARASVALEGALGLLLLLGLFLPVAVEQIVHQRGDLADLVFLELPREHRRHVLDHAAALRLVDRLRGRPDQPRRRFSLAAGAVR